MRTTAKIISAIFHPLLMVSYMLILLLLINPYLFGINHISEQAGVLQIIRVVISTFLIPAFAMVMLSFLSESQSQEISIRESRFIPFIITGTFYLWLSINFIYNPDIPKLFTSFLLGATIALFLAFFINLFSKISLHTVGIGSLLAMIMITMLLLDYHSFLISFFGLGSLEISMNTLLLIILLFAGLVGTSRFLLEEHEPMDILWRLHRGDFIAVFGFAVFYFVVAKPEWGQRLATTIQAKPI